MKRTRLSRAIIRLMAKPVLLWLLVALPLLGRACDMAIIPDSNVNLATNIRDVLNAAGGSVTDNTLTFFQPVANINKWAKYKPIRKKGDFLDNISNWWQNDNKQCGFKIPVVSNVIASYEQGVWEYEMPRGGINEPLRLPDFRGYESSLRIPFVHSNIKSTDYLTYNVGVDYGVVLSFIKENNTNMLTCNDVYLNGEFPIGEMFLHYTVARLSDGKYYATPASSTLKYYLNQAEKIVVNLRNIYGLNLTAGETIYVFLGLTRGDKFVAIPSNNIFINPVPVHIIEEPAVELMNFHLIINITYDKDTGYHFGLPVDSNNVLTRSSISVTNDDVVITFTIKNKYDYEITINTLDIKWMMPPYDGSIVIPMEPYTTPTTETIAPNDFRNLNLKCKMFQYINPGISPQAFALRCFLDNKLIGEADFYAKSDN